MPDIETKAKRAEISATFPVPDNVLKQSVLLNAVSSAMDTLEKAINEALTSNGYSDSKATVEARVISPSSATGKPRTRKPATVPASGSTAPGNRSKTAT